MKKLLFVCFVLSIPLFSYAQLNISKSASSSKEDYLYKDRYTSIRYNGEQYIVNCRDLLSSRVFPLYLGEEREEAKKSLQQLDEWCKKAKKSDYIEIKQNDGTTVTIYRMAERLAMSYGDVDFIKAKISNLALTAAFGPRLNNKHVNDPFFGYIAVTAFQIALKKLGD